MTRSVLVAGSFLLVGFFATYVLLAPAPKPATAPATEFSAVRALEHSKATAREPHPMGTAANESVRGYILGKLLEMGVEAEEQPAQHAVGGQTIEVSTNVIGRIAGTANTKAFALMAHFDSTPYGPGAADDGSGVVAMLETARALKAGSPLKNDILFVFTDGEESGEVGASAFMQSPWADKVGVICNFEARGTSGPSMMFETSPGNGWLIPEAAKAGVDIRACSLMYSVYKMMPFNSDFSVAKKRGLKGFNAAFIDNFAWYHTKNDTPEHMSLASLQNHGSYALGLARHFGNLPLDGDLVKPDLVYFNTVGSHMVWYPMAWSNYVTWAAVIVFVLALLLGIFRGHATIPGFIGGIFAFAFTAVLSALAALVALGLVYGPDKLYAQYTTNITHLPDLLALNHNALYGWACGVLAVGVFMACYQGLSRWLRIGNLAAGALAWWAAGAVAIQRFMPGGSYIAAWPLLFASLGLAISFLRKRDASPLSAGMFLLGIFAVPGLVLVAPSYQVLLSTIMVMTAPGLALLMVLILSLLIPQVPLMTTPNRWWLSACATVLGVLMLAYGAANSSYTPERPKLNSLAYGLNLDTGSAAWFSYDKALDEWTSNFFPANGGQPPRGTISEFISDDDRSYWKAPAPAAAYEGPKLQVVGDSTGPDGRTLTVHVSMPERPMWMKVRLVSDNTVHSATAFGQQLKGGGKNWQMSFRGLPREGADLTLKINAGAPLVLEVVPELLGLPALPGVPARPGHMAVEPNTIRRPWSFRGDSVFLVRRFDLSAGTGGSVS